MSLPAFSVRQIVRTYQDHKLLAFFYRELIELALGIAVAEADEERDRDSRTVVRVDVLVEKVRSVAVIERLGGRALGDALKRQELVVVLQAEGDRVRRILGRVEENRHFNVHVLR